MSQYSINTHTVRDNAELLDAIGKPVIQVLIYTDDPVMVDEDGIFGIRELRRQLTAHRPAFAEIDLSIISRNSGPKPTQHADHKIDDELIRERFDEIWFFGLHQANKPRYKLDFPGGGGPRSELELDEVAALEDWMRVDPTNGSKGIGVLVSGDHANPPPDEQLSSDPDKFCPPGMDHQRFLGLGRALGKKIPRAGLLRKWEGPPTHCAEDSFNTLFPPPSEIDPFPQRLILPRFDRLGNPDPTGEPHEVFRGKNDALIQVLPDHEHEGTVVLPDDFPEEVWLPGTHFQPVPQFIAHGVDRRTGQPLNILAAYNGDAAGLGRIISDSSWHHYFNANLQSLSASNLGLPEADQIGQLYSNLVVWLAPLATRMAMAIAMFRWLTTHPLMIEEIGAGPLNIGNLALRLLRRVASDCEIDELFVAACPTPLRERFKTLNFPHEPEVGQLPTVEVLLGSIISKYFEYVSRLEENADLSDKQLRDIIDDGFSAAFQVNLVSAATLSCQSLSILLSFAPDSVPPEVTGSIKCPEFLQLTSQSQERRTTMTTTTQRYFFDIRLDRGGTEVLTLDLETDCLGSICHLSGQLTSGTSERFDVRGIRFGNRVYLEFPFRRVKIVMGGVRDSNDKFHMRFIAAPRDQLLAESSVVPPTDPDVGDTGTGTATQTFVNEENPMRRAS